MKKPFYLVLILFSLSIVFACTKSEKDPDGQKGLAGNIYFSWSNEGVQRLNMSSLEKKLILPPDTKRNGFDISRNQQKLLVLTDIQGDYDQEELKVINQGNDKVTWSKKIPKGDHSGYTNPLLSYDENYILATSFLPEKIIIIDLKKDETHVLNELQGKTFKEAIWMPDGSILLCTDDAIYQSALPFEQVNLIIKPGFDSWHSPAVSPDGKRIAFVGGNHIQMIGADGTNLTQVSESSGKEGAPTFSPDGKFLVAGMHQFAGGAGPWGSYYNMYIFPADGKKHIIEEGKNSGNVRMVVPKNEKYVQSFNNKIQWR